MATTTSEQVRPSALARILGELELTKTTIGALVLGWAAIWAVCVLAQKPLAGVAATACWLAAVPAAHAWSDLRHLRRRWRSGDYFPRPVHVRYHRWLAPAALLVGILFGYRLW